MAVVSKKDFAELARIGKSALSNLIRRKRLPVSGGGIDLEDTDVQEYLASKGIRVEPPPKKPVKAQNGVAYYPPPDPMDATGLQDKETLSRKKLAAQTQQIDLKNAQIEERLVSRKVMLRGVWNPLETFLVRILSDGAKTISKTGHPLVKSGGTREELEIAVRAELTSFIVPLKESIQKALKLENV